MLQERARDDHVADARPRVEAARGAGEDRLARAELVHQQRRRHRRRDLADARERDDDVVAVEMADPELAAGQAHRLLVGHRGEERAELFVERGGDGDAGHAGVLLFTNVGARRCFVACS